MHRKSNTQVERRSTPVTREGGGEPCDLKHLVGLWKRRKTTLFQKASEAGWMEIKELKGITNFHVIGVIATKVCNPHFFFNYFLIDDLYIWTRQLKFKFLLSKFMNYPNQKKQ